MTHDELRIAHEARNQGVPDGFICMRDGITIPTQPESRFGFEFFCWRSPEMVKEMDAFIQHAKGKGYFLDVGAMHGVFSLVFKALNLDSVCVAFEPHSESFAILERNTSDLNYVNTHNSALSDHDGSLTMHEEWDMHLVSGNQKDGSGVITIRCRKGDEWLSGAPFGLLKIDVEGHEMKVLRGLTKTVEDNHPTIFLEVHPSRLTPEGDSINDLIMFLSAHGYTATNVETDQPMTWDELAAAVQETRIVLT